MEEPDDNDVMEFLKTTDRVPTTVELTKEQQKEFLDSLKNTIRQSDSVSIIVPTADKEKEIQSVETEETCPHCEMTDTYNLPKDRMTAVCSKCGKTIVLCNRCTSSGEDYSACSDCVYCDVANFYNYLRKKNTIEQFLAALNPSLVDMTRSDMTVTYDDFVFDTFGDDVIWDMNYWEIYGLIINSMITEDTPESDVVDFIKDIIKRNRRNHNKN